jgi:transposase-like protein
VKHSVLTHVGVSDMTREVISTIERRRHWSDDEKLRIMSEALAPNAVASVVADSNGGMSVAALHVAPARGPVT